MSAIKWAALERRALLKICPRLPSLDRQVALDLVLSLILAGQVAWAVAAAWAADLAADLVADLAADLVADSVVVWEEGCSSRVLLHLQRSCRKSSHHCRALA